MDHNAEVSQWLAGSLGSCAKNLDPENILGSIGFAGDDADELIEAFAAQFGVDMSSFSPWHHYNADEPPFFRRYRPVTSDGRTLGDLPISLTDLADSAASGRWEMTYAGRHLRHRSLVLRWLAAGVTIVLAFLAARYLK